MMAIRVANVEKIEETATCQMKTTDICKYAAEQSIAVEVALKQGIEAKSKEFIEKGAEVYAKV